MAKHLMHFIIFFWGRFSESRGYIIRRRPKTMPLDWRHQEKAAGRVHPKVINRLEARWARKRKGRRALTHKQWCRRIWWRQQYKVLRKWPRIVDDGEILYLNAQTRAKRVELELLQKYEWRNNFYEQKKNNYDYVRLWSNQKLGKYWWNAVWFYAWARNHRCYYYPEANAGEVSWQKVESVLCFCWLGKNLW